MYSEKASYLKLIKVEKVCNYCRKSDCIRLFYIQKKFNNSNKFYFKSFCGDLKHLEIIIFWQYFSTK